MNLTYVLMRSFCIFCHSSVRIWLAL